MLGDHQTWVPHNLIKQKIAFFADRKSHPGVYYTEYEKAEGNDMIFILKRADNTEYEIELNGTASVAKISSQQFYQSLVDSTTERLITTVSRKGDKQVDKEAYAASYKQLLRDIQVLEPNNWPVDADADYGEEAIARLARRFLCDAISRDLKEDFCIFKASQGTTVGDNLKVLQKAVDTVIISTAQCERCFSVMNDIVTPIRNSLKIKRVAMLIFIKILGPNVSACKPKSFVKKWLRQGRRCADCVTSVKRSHIDPTESPFGCFVELFNA